MDTSPALLMFEELDGVVIMMMAALLRMDVDGKKKDRKSLKWNNNLLHASQISDSHIALRGGRSITVDVS